MQDELLMVQHEPVYTLGAGSSLKHLRCHADALPYSLLRTERGGEVTFHGPGQLVLYPILDLHRHRCDLHWYLRNLEEVALIALREVSGIEGKRIEGQTGVWVDDAKVAAIGIRAKRWVTYHGLALNVAMDLDPFEHIIPCGIHDRGVTCVRDLLSPNGHSMHDQHTMDASLMREYRYALPDAFSQVFQSDLIPVPNHPMVYRFMSEEDVCGEASREITPNVIETATGVTEELFTSLLGKIRIWEGQLIEGEHWRRLVAVSPTKGLTYVGRDDEILVFRTADLITTAQSSEEKEKDITPPTCSVLSTPGRVQILSIGPSEKYLLACHAAPCLTVYGVEPFLSPPAILQKRIDVDRPCVSVAWIDAQSFVILTDEQKALEVTVADGGVKKWIVTDALIAMDVRHSASVWVKAASPSVVCVCGVVDVDLKRVMKFVPGEDGELIVSSVKILETGMLVFTVVAMEGSERVGMNMGILKWCPSTHAVSVYPDTIDFYLPEKVESLDPRLNPCLSAEWIPRWNVWLIGCGEETSCPYRLILRDAEEMEFTCPDASFVWPLTAHHDDNLMLGMGLDVSHPMKLKSPIMTEGAQQRTCHSVIAASEDGLLVITALAKDMDDPDPQPSVVSPKSERRQKAESSVSESATDPESSSRTDYDAVETAHPPLSRKDAKKAARDDPESSDATETAKSRPRANEEKDKRPLLEKQLIRRMIQRYNEDTAKHLQQFNVIRRLTDTTKLMKMQSIDLAFRVRRSVEVLEENEADEKLQQTVDLVNRLQDRIVTVHQITQSFQFNLTKRTSGADRLEWDVEETIQELVRQKKELQRIRTETKALRAKPNIASAVNRCMRDLQQIPDNGIEIMKDFFAWADSKPIITETDDVMFSDEETSDKMWRQVSEKTTVNVSNIRTENLDIPEENETTSYVLKRMRSDDGGEAGDQYEVVTESDAGQSTSTDETSVETESDSDRLELCTEEEIKQIVQAQAVVKAEETAEGRMDGRTLTPQEKHDENVFSRILHCGASWDVPVPGPTAVKLPAAPAVPSMEQFLRNLGQEEKTVLQREDAEPSKSPTKETRSGRQTSASPDPTPQLPSSTLPPSSSSPHLPSSRDTVSTKPQGMGSFQAGGFSGFGMPSLMGSVGVAPQLGSLGNARQSMSSGVGGGFGAYARSENVFGTLAHAQQGGQQLNAFSVLAQQQGSRPFSGMTPSSSGFTPPSKDGSSKLFEMRK